METFSALLALCEGNPPVTSGFPSQRPVAQSFDIFFDLHPKTVKQAVETQVIHTMDLLWEKFQWILPLYMKPISFQSKALVACSVTAAIFIDFCLKNWMCFPTLVKNCFCFKLFPHIGKKANEYLNSAEQIPRNWNVDQLSMLITSWDII